MVKFWVTFALIVAAIGTLSNRDLLWTHAPFSFDMNVASAAGERGSGVEKADLRKVPAFTKIHAEGAGVLDVDVKAGNPGGTIEISADDTCSTSSAPTSSTARSRSRATSRAPDRSPTAAI